MPRLVLMLRGINVGPNRRIPMAQLRSLLEQAGFADVATYVQSGNVVLGSDEAPDAVAVRVAQLIERQFGFAVAVTTRTAAQLASVVAHDPIEGAAADPKHYQVTFLSAEPPPDASDRLRARASDRERLAVHGREIYSWHPDGIAGSRLATGLTATALGASATARNWTTVTTLLTMTAG